MLKPVFENSFKPAPAATKKQIETLIQSLRTPLSAKESAAIDKASKNPYREIKSSNWILPPYLPPKSYFDYLAYSNGGQYCHDDYDIILFSTKEFRENLLGYNVPEYMPKALPFGGNGGGDFYFFDMRSKQEQESGEVEEIISPSFGCEAQTEFPIYFASYIGMSYENATFVADSFLDFAQGRFESHE